MTKNMHYLSGVLCSFFPVIVAVEFSNFSNESFSYTFFISAICVFAMILGSNAPDYLELRYKKKTKNKKGDVIYASTTVLPHRGVTHTLMIWCVLSYMMHRMAFQPIEYNEVYLFAFSYSFGAVVHLFGDLPNKKGIPIFPFCPKFCLNLWKCSKNEKLTCFLLVILTFILSIFYSEELYTSVKDVYIFIEEIFALGWSFSN